MMSRGVGTICLMLLPAACERGQPAASRVTVSTADVHRFAALWKKDTGSRCTSLRTYLDSASAGLRAYTRKFDVDGDALCAAVRRSPDRYNAVVANVLVFD